MGDEGVVALIAGAGFLYVILALAFYFIPGFIASSRDHQYSGIIWLVNIFAGWTGFVWLGLLVWAAIGDSKQEEKLKKANLQKNIAEHNKLEKSKSNMGFSDELRKLKSLLDDEIITQEEFDKKKSELMEL
jgi:apolipoprotein N-acyltransferase